MDQRIYRSQTIRQPRAHSGAHADRNAGSQPHTGTDAGSNAHPGSHAPSEPTDTTIPLPALGIGSTWTRPADGMLMVYVPKGAFTMGTTADQAMAECQKFRSNCQRDWFVNEEPSHTVILDAFWIDKTEVTNAIYALCVQKGDCQAPSSSYSNSRGNYFGNAAI